MKNLSKLLLVLFSFNFCFSQINVEQIKKNVADNPQEYYYEYLEIFKKSPEKLSQEQLNQLYYGSRFIKSEYALVNYNNDYEKIWKFAKKGMSKGKAQKIVSFAEEKYLKNPLEKEILLNMTVIYSALDETKKKEICEAQYKAIINTIENSGTGLSEDSPVCVIRAGDMISMLNRVMVGFGDFKQKDKELPDGSLLTEYSVGENKIFVKLVGGIQF